MAPTELPVELVDDILDEATSTLDASSISSIALTSHAFRIHANRARFSSLVPFRGAGHGIQHTAKGIRGLAEIIRSGRSIDTMPGVAAFAMSFSLQMIGYYDEVTPALHDGSLAYIFDNIFRPCPTYMPSSVTSTTRSLTLYVYRWSNEDFEDYDDHRYNGLRWHTMNLKLLKALKNLLRFSQMNRLELVEMHDIPQDFLQGSGVKHLSLYNISLYPFGSSSHSDIMPRNEPAILLETLDIDGRTVPSDTIDRIVYPYSNFPPSNGDKLPHLTNFSIDIPYDSTFKTLNEILRNSPALESLSIILWMEENFSKHDCIVHYEHLQKLRFLSFRSNSTTPSPLISHIISRTLPPNIRDLQLVFVLHNTNHPRDISRRLDGMDIGNLDNYLIHPALELLTRIGIALEVEISSAYEKYKTSDYLQQWCTQLAEKFPLLRKKNRRTHTLVRWKD